MSIADAAEFAERWAENQRGMVEVAAALRSIGSLEQAIQERVMALEALASVYLTKQAEITDAEKALAGIRADHGDATNAHDMCLMQSADAASADAVAVLYAANAQAAAIVEAARRDMEDARAVHDATMAVAVLELRAEQDSASGLRAEIAALTADHDALAAKIEDMKAAARNALG